MSFDDYQTLKFERRPNGVLLITLDRPDRKNAINATMHTELVRVWDEVARDKATSVAVITGAGDHFCGGADAEMVQDSSDPGADIEHSLMEAMSIPLNMVGCAKPIVSAINGTAIAGGLAVALCADITVAADDAFLCDGHIRAGLVPGDHSALIWPMLCGMAKSRYYLMTGRGLKGAEAERIGLVTMCRPRDQVLETALRIADDLGTGPQVALRFTKRALNNWLRMAQPIFENSTALEQLSLFHPDVQEGVSAMKEGRKPVFPSAQVSED